MKISARLLVIEFAALLLFVVAASVGFLAWRLSQGPIDLEFIRPRIERSLAEARGGLPVRIDRLALEWSRDRSQVEAAAHGVTAFDRNGQSVSRAERAVITLNAAALVSGKLQTERLRIENGRASVLRNRDGVWSLAGVVFLREPVSAAKPFDPLRDLNWTTLATPIRALVSAGSFERIELVNFSLDVTDEGAGSAWSANPVNAAWSATGEGVALSLDARLLAAGEPNSIRIALSADGEVSRATGRLTLEGVDPLTVAGMFGYAGQAFVSHSPADAAFTVEASEANGLTKALLNLSGVTGRGNAGGVDFAIEDLAFDAAYDPATRLVSLNTLNIRSDRLTGAFSGTMDASQFVGREGSQPIAFKLSGRDFTVAATPVFEQPWSFASGEIEASISPDLLKLTVAELKAVTGGLSANARGDIWFDGPPEARQIGMKLRATGSGAVTPAQLIAFWPVRLGADGRIWVRDHILAGTATRADLTIDWPPGANAAGFLPDEHLTLDFEVADASVSFLSDFPPVTGVKGVGRMRGNSLSMDLTGGTMKTWQVDDGKVVLPRFHPGGATMEVTATGRGELRELMRVLDASNLNIGEKYGLSVERMGGQGGIEVLIQRSMRSEVAETDLKYLIKGGFLNASAPDLAAGFGLVDSDVTFEVSETALSIAGAGRFGPAPVVFDWKERFHSSGDAGSELVASAKVTPDLLNAFGVSARNVMQGEADVELRAAGSGRDFTSITANVDFTRSALDIAELGWSKKFDAPARGSFRYGKDSSRALLHGDIRADGLELIGEAILDPSGALTSAVIERIFSRGNLDLRGSVRQRDNGGYKLSLSGPFFDASPWMDSFLSMSESETEAAKPIGGPAGSSSPPFEIALNADRLRLREDAELTRASVTMRIDEGGPIDGHVTGVIAPGKGVDVRIGSDAGARTVTMRSDDAGFAARVLMKAEYLLGGQLELTARFDGADGTAQVTMTDVRLRNAPLLAQILSLASLRGLTDVLNGDGVLFTRIDAPIKLSAGRIDIPGLRASGPAMGLTARGWIAPARGELSLDGVLVPSFGVNSALGGLPIIGDLFVSRQGEGLFAPTYSVRGTLARARVSINPIAALTPGVLRRIFENPTEAPPASVEAP